MTVMKEFLLDENLLGLSTYLIKIKHRKVGDEGCPEPGSSDIVIAEYAERHNLIVVTNDHGLIKQCEILKIEYITIDEQKILDKFYDKIIERINKN